MDSIVIPDIDDDLKRRLVARATSHGKTLEAEARDILAEALVVDDDEVEPDNLYDAIRAIVEPIGGFELEPFPDEPMGEPIKFD